MSQPPWQFSGVSGGEWSSMSCEMFVVVCQLMRHPSGRHLPVNPAPCARWLWSAFDWLPSLSASFQSVTHHSFQLRWCVPVASFLSDALQGSSSLHIMHSEMWNLLPQFGSTSSASHFYTCTVLSCVKLHLRISCFVGIDLYFCTRFLMNSYWKFLVEMFMGNIVVLAERR